MLPCLAQLALFLLALRIRGSLLWAVLFLSALLAVWISAKWLKQSTRPSLRRLKGTKLVQSMTTDVQISPVMLLLSVVCLAMLLKPLFLHPIYRERSDLSGHVIWHSVALGLAIHPAINEVYNGSDKVRAQVRPRASRRYEKTLLGRWVNWRSLSLLWGGRLGKWLHDPDTRKNWGFLVRCVYGVLYRPDDQDAYTAAFSWENSHGASETSLFLFEPAESVNWSSTYRYFGRREIPGSRPFDDRVDFNWRKYEDVLYLVCKRTVWEYPIQTLELALVIKPLRFVYYYFDEFVVKIAPHYFGVQNALTSLILTFSFVYACILSRGAPLSNLRDIRAMLIGLYAFSMIPSMVIYAAPHVISDTALVFTISLAFLLLLFCRRWLGDDRSASSAPR